MNVDLAERRGGEKRKEKKREEKRKRGIGEVRIEDEKKQEQSRSG